LPQKPFIIRFEIEGGQPRFLLLAAVLDAQRRSLR
jgi:hypothetical protein